MKLGDPQLVDWRRSAEIWQGKIIQGQRLLTQQVPLRNAVFKVAAAIDLPLKISSQVSLSLTAPVKQLASVAP